MIKIEKEPIYKNVVNEYYDDTVTSGFDGWLRETYRCKRLFKSGYGFNSNHYYFAFDNPEDATIFKLKFACNGAA